MLIISVFFCVVMSPDRAVFTADRYIFNVEGIADQYVFIFIFLN